MAAISIMAPEKFMFERSFDTDKPAIAAVEAEEVVEEAEDPEIEVPSFSEEDLENAKKEAFEQGKAEALKESATAIENQIVDTTKSIGEKLDSLIVSQLIANKDIFSDAMLVSHAVTKKLLPSIAAEQSLPEIENIIRQVLPQVLEEPRVVVHINPAIEDLLNERIAQISADTYFEGRLLITASESIGEGDCKIEWSNGGAERNLENLISDTNAIIEANLEALEGGFVPSPDACDLDKLDKNPPPSTDTGESDAATKPATNPAITESATDSSDTAPSPEPHAGSPAPQPAAQKEDEVPEATTDVTTNEAQNSGENEAFLSDETVAATPDQNEPASVLDSRPENNSETISSEDV